jgi:putative colanic acid biosynthesis glycosyltransferase
LKALIINSVCKFGSTGAIAYNLHRHLKKSGHKSIVCYGRGDIYPEEPDLIKLDSNLEVKIHAGLARLTGLQGFFSNTATNRLLNLIKKDPPDVVYLLNLHGYYINEFRLINFLKRSNIFTVYLMMDEYPFMGKCCYSYDCEKYKTGCSNCPLVKDYPKSIFFDTSKFIFGKKEKIYKSWKNVIFATVPFVVEKSLSSKLNQGHSFYKLDTGIDLQGTYRIKDTIELRTRLNIPNDHKVVLNVGPVSNPRKGINYFIDVAQKLKDEKITFINVGFDGDRNSLSKNYIPIDYVSNQDELADYYSLADLLVCTSLADAMPNVCLQALACGTPVCGFNISGTPYVASKEFGTFVEPGNITELSNVIISTPQKTIKRSESCRDYAMSRYSNEHYYYKVERLGVTRSNNFS